MLSSPASQFLKFGTTEFMKLQLIELYLSVCLVYDKHPVMKY